MLRLVTEKLNDEELHAVAGDLDGYVKIVVDGELKILAAGGKRHADGEALLLESGSRQAHLWGGGLDLETGEIDFDSIINIRPAQGNPSREVLSPEIRKAMTEIVRSLLR